MAQSRSLRGRVLLFHIHHCEFFLLDLILGCPIHEVQQQQSVLGLCQAYRLGRQAEGTKVGTVNTKTLHGKVKFGEAGTSVAMLSSREKVGS